jgi:plasmid stability protein
MAILHVRNVPDELYESIRRQAQTQNRSISAEVIVLLQRALAGSDRSQDEILSGIRRRRFYNPLEAGAPPSTTLLREDRAR